MPKALPPDGDFGPFDDSPDAAADSGINQHSISRVTVESLFGRYSYTLPSESDTVDLSRLFILYGDNGGGKTTLLQMIYHALDPQDKMGHRTFLANTRFQRFAIEFRNGTIFEARRDKSKNIGTYTVSLFNSGRTLANVTFEAASEKERFVVRTASDEPTYAELMQQLKSLGLILHYLSDDRRHQATLQDRADPDLQTAARLALEQASSVVLASQPARRATSSNVEQAIAAVDHWLLRQVRTASLRGSGNVNSIYEQVATGIASASPTPPSESSATAQELAKRVKHLHTKSKAFAHFGLSTPFATDGLIDSLTTAPAQSAGILCTVLAPYVDSIEARLAALENIYHVMSSFSETVNSYYIDKTVSCHADKGIRIRCDGGPLPPSSLSSGEQQLLLLFCNAILARDISRKRSTLFLIDEPELSLNVKWQRKLIRSLLEMSGGANVQFLLATHSMELLAQHRSHVVKLNNTESSASIPEEGTSNAPTSEG